MTEILGTPNLAKRAANFMARTGLFGELGKACLADAEQNPQQTEENLEAGHRTTGLSSMAKVDIPSVQLHSQTQVTPEMAE